MTRATYDQTHKLDDYQFTRLRTEVNFGSREVVTEQIAGFDGEKFAQQTVTYVPALFTYWREVLDNAIDEVVGKGHGSSVWFSFDESSMVFEVEDDGRGIPSDLVQQLLAEARAGRNFGARDAVAGTNGVGAATTNFTSEFFEVTSSHGGVRHHQVFREDLKNDRHDVGVPTKTKTQDHGLKIRFKPSPSVYHNVVMPESFVRARIYDVAAAYPELKVHYNGSRIKLPRGGLLAGLETIDIEVRGTTEVVHSSAREIGVKESTTTTHPFKSVFRLVPNFHTERGDHVHTMVNMILATNGGSHVQEFRSCLYGGLMEALAKEARRRKLKLARQDVEQGLLIYNVTRMHAAVFDGQAKTRLTNPEAAKAIKAQLSDQKFYAGLVRNNQKWVDSIFERCAERTESKDMSDAIRESKKGLKVRVAKLTDATGSDRSKCILLIAEGDSAIEGSKSVRDHKIHAGLPLRGKVMNVSGESVAKVVANEELKSLMSAIGLSIGQRAIPRSKLRYGQVWITTDEDEDGKNIAALLVNFFHRFWPELFDPDLPPFICKMETPFIILERGKGKAAERKYFYGRTVGQYDPADYKGWNAIRAKGLGRLQPPHWKDALERPSLIPIVDSNGDLKEALDLIFNDARPDDRKTWLEADRTA